MSEKLIVTVINEKTREVYIRKFVEVSDTDIATILLGVDTAIEDWIADGSDSGRNSA